MLPKSSYRSVDPQTLHENVHQVDHVTNGPTNSAGITTMLPLRLCGGKPLVAVTRERHYGPSRLRVNDDDYAVMLPVSMTTCLPYLPYAQLPIDTAIVIAPMKTGDSPTNSPTVTLTLSSIGCSNAELKHWLNHGLLADTNAEGIHS